MTQRIYVGNLPFSADDEEIRQLFGQYGTVETVSLITDRRTGLPRGFGFVEMTNGMEEAISALDQTAIGGRNLTVNPARPRKNGGGARRSGGDAVFSAANLRLLHAKLFSADLGDQPALR